MPARDRGGLRPRPGGADEAGARTGEPAQQDSDLLAGSAPQRTVAGQHGLPSGDQGFDHRHRRDPAAGDPGGGEPAVADDRQFPAAVAVRSGSDEFRDRRERGLAVRAADGTDQSGQFVAMAGGLFVMPPLRHLLQPRRGKVQRATVVPGDEPAGGFDGGRVLGDGLPARARRSAAAEFRQDTRGSGRLGGGDALRAGAQTGGVGEGFGGGARVGLIAERPERARARQPDHGEPGKASSVRLIHQAWCGFFERRLYAGRCAAISRSSRISASRECAHSMASTRSASATISRIRPRLSEPVK